jgi:hypothetical protein
MVEPSENSKVRLEKEYDFILDFLTNSKPVTGKDMARAGRENGFDWAREHANSRLYTLWRFGKVLKIETEKAPLWTLPIYAEKYAEAQSGLRKTNTVYLEKELPLAADRSMDIEIAGTRIEFAFNYKMSSNDAYMYGDWLEDKIFVSLNPNHPFWGTFMVDEEKVSLQLTNTAIDVYVQWQVVRSVAPIDSVKLLHLRDAAMREIASKDSN